MKRSELLVTASLLPIDYALTVIVLVLVYHLRFSEFVSEYLPVLFVLPFDKYFQLVFVAGLIFVLSNALVGLYAIRPKRLVNELLSSFLGGTLGTAIIVITFFFRRDLFESRAIVLFAWIAVVLVVAINHILIRIMQRRMYRKGIGVHRVLLVGGSAGEMSKFLKRSPSLGLVTVQAEIDVPSACEIIPQLAAKDVIDEVFMLDQVGDSEIMQKLLDTCHDNHLTFRYATDTFGARATNMSMDVIGGMPILEIRAGISTSLNVSNTTNISFTFGA